MRHESNTPRFCIQYRNQYGEWINHTLCEDSAEMHNLLTLYGMDNWRGVQIPDGEIWRTNENNGHGIY